MQLLHPADEQLSEEYISGELDIFWALFSIKSKKLRIPIHLQNEDYQSVYPIKLKSLPNKDSGNKKA